MSIWVEAARPRTLPAAVAPVLVGTATADRFVAWRFAAALVVGLAVQVAVNYANDYFDGVRGVDTPGRVGPRRAVAAGLVEPARMRGAMVAALGVAALAGLALAVAAGWQLLVVGVACFAAALGYSGGARPYASRGLGELFVFVFFGLVATLGSAYVQQEALPPIAVVPAIAMGLLAVAILLANNLRDLDTDRDAGKATLAVRVGRPRTRALYRNCLLGALVAVPMTAVIVGSGWPLLALAAAPAARSPLRAVMNRREPAALIAALGGTARLELVYALLLAVGLWLAG